MASLNEKPLTTPHDLSSSETGSSTLHHLTTDDATLTTADDLALAASGYTPQLKRSFSILSILGIGFSLTNSWFAISAALVTGINSGGPVLLVYGIPMMALISCCVGVSLSELASAMPNAGGQYFWAGELAGGLMGGKWKRGVSYVTGWIAYAGAVFTSAAVAAAVGAAVVGCWQLAHPEFTIKPWHTFLTYQITNALTLLLNLSSRLLPRLSTATLSISLLSFLLILLTIPSSAPTHQPPSFIFTTFINTTGWSSNTIAFIVGLVNCNWAFACLDCATHLAEEVPRPERTVPIAIMGTVGIGFVTAWGFAIAMFLSIVGDWTEIVATTTGVPILQLFYNATQHRAGAVVLESLIIATGIGCLVACHTWQSRLCWSFARDRGVPFHQTFAKVHPTLGVPLNAHFVSCGLVAVVGCLYLASYTAFNSMVTASIVLLYISYSLPITLLLLRGRSVLLTLSPSGTTPPFFLGKFGLVANVVTLLWTLFTLVMYSFPYTMPVAGGNMNYVSVVYAVVGLVIAVDWGVRGRREFALHGGRGGANGDGGDGSSENFGSTLAQNGSHVMGSGDEGKAYEGITISPTANKCVKDLRSGAGD